MAILLSGLFILGLDTGPQMLNQNVDIVFVMTGGSFETEVVANRMFTEMFKFRNFGRASSLAVILLVVTIPIMILNIRNLRRQGIGA